MTKDIFLFEGYERGAMLDSAKGTAFGLLNSVTEFVDHERRAKSTDHRLESANGHCTLLHTSMSYGLLEASTHRIARAFGVLKRFRILGSSYRNRRLRVGLHFNLIVAIFNIELVKI